MYDLVHADQEAASAACRPGADFLGPHRAAMQVLAHGLVELGEHEAALGKAWHLPTPAPTTARAFIETMFTQVQRPAKVARLGARSARVLGIGWPVLREGAFRA